MSLFVVDVAALANADEGAALVLDEVELDRGGAPVPPAQVHDPAGLGHDLGPPREPLVVSLSRGQRAVDRLPRRPHSVRCLISMSSRAACFVSIDAARVTGVPPFAPLGYLVKVTGSPSRGRSRPGCRSRGSVGRERRRRSCASPRG